MTVESLNANRRKLMARARDYASAAQRPVNPRLIRGDVVGESLEDLMDMLIEVLRVCPVECMEVVETVEMIECAHCQQPMVKVNARARYCRDRCRQAATHARRKNRVAS